LRGTFRPLNQCRTCGYTWHPRGHNLSRVCPACGSGDVQVHPFEQLKTALTLGTMCFVALCAGVALCNDPPPARGHSQTARATASQGGTVQLTRACDLWGFDAAGEPVVLAKAPAGATYDVVAVDDKSYQIRTSEGLTAWIVLRCVR
jgi:hypothetical protein